LEADVLGGWSTFKKFWWFENMSGSPVGEVRILTIIIIIKQMNGQYSIFSPGDPRA
jgi:hypothetical protein